MKKAFLLLAIIAVSVATNFPKSSKAEIAKRGFTAAMNKDADTFISMCDENFVANFYNEDTDVPRAVFKGKEGAKAFMDRRNSFEVYNFTNMQYQEIGQKVVITGRFEGKMKDKPSYTKDYLGVAVFKDDKILYYHAF